MIVTRSKDAAEILLKLGACRQVAVIGCGLCATSCGTGGEPQVLAAREMLVAAGKAVPWTAMVEGVCHRLLSRKCLQGRPTVDAYLILACGSGVQTVAALVAAPTIPALDTLYLGSARRAGEMEEKCSLCGRCDVDLFGGICPATLCAKGLMNGPCGGMDQGRCETNAEKECAWYRIYLIAEETGQLAEFETRHAPRGGRGPVR